MTKQAMVLQHLIVNGSITSLEAFEQYKATRLAAIIFALRKKGFDIYAEMEKGKDCHYARYVLVRNNGRT